MKTFGIAILCIVLIILAGAGGYWYGHHNSSANQLPEAATQPDTTQETEPQPVAQVTTQPLLRGRITEALTAYGTVVPRTTDQQTVSAQVETKVAQLLVSPGQLVEAGQPVAQVDPSPDTSLQLLQAKNNADAAAHDLAGAQQRFNMKLATLQELQTAQNAMRDAKLKLDDLKRRGATGPQVLKAPRAGVVANVRATLGEVVPAGSPLLEIDDQKNVEVRLGVGADDATRLKIDQPVELFPSDGKGVPIQGKIRLITRRVNPATRLVDVFVSLPPNSGLLLDSYMLAHVTVASDVGLLAPRSAVLPEGGGYQLFTVQNGHAVKHDVSIGLETDKQYEVADKSDSLKPGERVVVSGNYELEDGMAVEAGSAQ